MSLAVKSRIVVFVLAVLVWLALTGLGVLVVSLFKKRHAKQLAALGLA